MIVDRYALVYPMFAMVVLTAFVLVRLFRSRVGAVKAGQITASYFRLYQGAVEPETTVKNSRHFVNLFEAPTLFYAVCIAAMVAQQSTPLMFGLACAYVAARIVHAAIHLGPNRLRYRVRAYFASWLVLGAMWVSLVYGVATHGHT